MSRVRLMLDFADEEHAADFLRKAASLFPEPVGAFSVESLDFMPSAGGIGRKHTYLVLPPRVGESYRRRLAVTRVESV